MVGRLAPVQREEKTIELDPSLRMKVSQRPKGWWDVLMGLNFIAWATNWLRGSFTLPRGDHIVVDTGKRLVNISGDRLDLSGVRIGDEVEFQLDAAVDPGGATFVKGKVVVVRDGPDPGVGESSGAKPHDDRSLERPLDKFDPVGDLIVRRAELFQAFRDGRLTQADLRKHWDDARDEALRLITAGDLSYYERRDQMQQVLDGAIFTHAELDDRGVRMDEFGLAALQPSWYA